MRARGGGPVTEPELMAAACSRCLQQECSRSLYGKSKFEHRISTWRGRLFETVPRMDEADPRFVVLSSKKFLEIDRGRVPEITSGSGSWIDPRDLDVPEESPQASPPVEPVVVAAPALPEPPPVVVPTPEPAPAVVESAPSPALVANHPLQPRLLNTPRPKPQMIGNRPEPGPKRDAWDVAPQETKGLPVVRPGARIKMGSGV